MGRFTRSGGDFGTVDLYDDGYPSKWPNDCTGSTITPNSATPDQAGM